MRKTFLRAINVATLCLASLAYAAGEPPPWAYPTPPPGYQPSADDGAPRHVPGSNESYSTPQVRDLFLAPDWHPESHPQMPPIVAVGRKPEVSAWGFGHRREGTGVSRDGSPCGVPADYILQQLADYKSGLRSTAVPGRKPQALMIAVAKAVTSDEALAAAAYFSGLKPRRNIRVIEAEQAPKTVVSWILARQEPEVGEPIGQRIIETPDQLEQFESRDPRATFTAYVPKLSVKRGEALATGQDLAVAPACTACHGTDLRGLGVIPGIAGRSPTYLFRQLHEFRIGARAGAGAAPMKDAVARMSQADMIAISAYAGSLPP